MLNGFPELVYETNGDPEVIEIPPNGLSIDLLRAVYRNNRLPLPTRMRAAMACLKHEVPSLGITAVVTDQGLAELLERRLKRMEHAAVIDAKPPQVEVKPPLPHCLIAGSAEYSCGVRLVLV